jgi:hypothetical protein
MYISIFIFNPTGIGNSVLNTIVLLEMSSVIHCQLPKIYGPEIFCNRGELRLGSIGLELSRFLRHPVKTQFSLNGELCYGIVSPNVHA